MLQESATYQSDYQTAWADSILTLKDLSKKMNELEDTNEEFIEPQRDDYDDDDDDFDVGLPDFLVVFFLNSLQ
jgi:hypothetical protein